MDPPLSAARTIAPRPFGRVPAIVVTLLAILSMRPAAAEEGFVDLFDGRSLDGWVAESHADSETHPDGRPVWSARDGEIVCDGLGFGFLRYAREAFADVTLRLEFLLGPSAEGSACNSGIGLRTGPFDRRRSRSTRPSIRGWELQLLDDAGAVPSTHSSGALYRYVAPLAVPIRAAGEWNELEVSLVGTRIRVVINGVLVHDVDQADHPALRTKPLSGFVALQNHGGQARFRHIRARRETAAPTGGAALEAQAAIVRARGDDIGIRGLLRFALEAAGKGWDREAIDDALALARSMQVTEEGPDRGHFRWRLADAGVSDRNACQFAGQLLALVRLEDDGRLVPRPAGQRLSQRGRTLVEAMARDALHAIRGQRVEPGYTNIFLTRAWNLLALGDLAGAEVVAEGEAAWSEWLSFTRSRGITEFLCPTYLGVDLDALALVADHAPSWKTRVEAEGALEYLWTSAAAHWLPAAQRLAGPRARDYDWLYGRGYADLHFADAGWLVVPPRPEGAGWLPGAPHEGLEVFRSACRWEPRGSLREDITAPRFVVERTGARPWQRVTDWVGLTSSIALSGEGRGAEDKTLVVNLPPPGAGPPGTPWRGANVTLVFDGQADPLGRERRRSAENPQGKPRHLKPYLLSSQRGPRATGVWFIDPRRSPFGVDPGSLEGLAAHLVFPAACPVWTVTAPLAPDDPLPPDAVLFLRGGSAALGVRFLAPEDPDLRAVSLEQAADPLDAEVRRLTATFARGVPDRGALVGLEMELVEGCDDEAFARFRREFAAREVCLEREGTRVRVGGSLPLELDLGAGDARPRRLLFEPVLPEGALLLVDGVEIGVGALEPAPPR